LVLLHQGIRTEKKNLLIFFFVLIQKRNKKYQGKATAPLPCRPAHLCTDRIFPFNASSIKPEVKLENPLRVWRNN
jgi:hypothetical protein